MTIKAVIYPSKTEPILPESLRPETLHVDRWYVQASEPVRQVLFSLAAVLAVGSVDPTLLTEPETLHVDRWFVQASEPVRVVPPINVVSAFTIDADLLTQPETLLVDRWFVPIVQPHRGWTPSYTWVYSSHQVGTVKYNPAGLQWWREPVVRASPKLGLHVSLQLTSIVDADLLTQPETLHVDRWFVAASEPVRPPQPINVAQSTIDPTTLDERISIDKWFAATSEPVRSLQSINVVLSTIDPIVATLVGPPRHEGLMRNVGRFLK